ncbi:hypothetical protein POTOM_048809 [Populus tomentosa]|uniref:glucan endo-1,3-beta-D-glucosidase n=1 Tax=Populus tomentosa TaxID=118781 RepID=A0A8X7YFX1_POPTO|nr:hypothetical protein POTOM_048809 [Populus tomentosa]
MFNQLQVDAVYSALNSMGFKNVEIVVAETGWPFKGDDNDVGPSIENAKAYNGNLIAHLRSMVGTPLMPGKSVDTFLFALYDEDLKPGRGSERSSGLFKTDLTMVYDVRLSTSSQDFQFRFFSSSNNSHLRSMHSLKILSTVENVLRRCVVSLVLHQKLQFNSLEAMRVDQLHPHRIP